MQNLFDQLKGYRLIKWFFLALLMFQMVGAWGKLTVQNSEMITFSGYPSGLIYHTFEMINQDSSKEPSNQLLDASSTNSQKENSGIKPEESSKVGLGWGVISKVLP